MNTKYNLSQREQDVLNLLWNTGESMTSMEILEHLKEEMQNATYVHRTINSLLNKGLLEVAGLNRNNTQYARKFQPALSREGYGAELLTYYGVEKKSFGKLVMTFLQREKKEDATKMIQQLEDMIKTFKAESEQKKS